MLDGAGDPSSVFIFQTDSTLITGSSSTVTLINGAQACNVFWQVGSSATLGTGSVFVGNILALTSITVTTGVTVHGRALARNGAVTLDNDTFTTPSCATDRPDDHHDGARGDDDDGAGGHDHHDGAGGHDHHDGAGGHHHHDGAGGHHDDDGGAGRDHHDDRGHQHDGPGVGHDDDADRGDHDHGCSDRGYERGAIDIDIGRGVGLERLGGLRLEHHDARDADDQRAHHLDVDDGVRSTGDRRPHRWSGRPGAAGHRLRCPRGPCQPAVTALVP